MNLKDKRVMVTGGSGFLGRQIVEQLQRVGADVYIPFSSVYNLKTKEGIISALYNLRPEIIIHAAATAGGIGLNQARPAELFFDNAIMGIQLIDEAYQYGVKKFVTVGTVCEYPKFTPAPFREIDLWSGYPEETNAAYGLAKKMLLVQGQAYRRQYDFNIIHLLPVNLYGPGDNFNKWSGHVIPALIMKISEAKKAGKDVVNIWGDGSASREFLYVEDAAKAVVLATQHYDFDAPINIGSGIEISINHLASLLALKLDYSGELVFDDSMPNGQPRRQLDTSRAEKHFGFKATTDFGVGLDRTITWYKECFK